MHKDDASSVRHPWTANLIHFSQARGTGAHLLLVCSPPLPPTVKPRLEAAEFFLPRILATYHPSPKSPFSTFWSTSWGAQIPGWHHSAGQTPQEHLKLETYAETLGKKCDSLLTQDTHCGVASKGLKRILCQLKMRKALGVLSCSESGLTNTEVPKGRLK